MNLFNKQEKIKEPIFLKEYDRESNLQLKKLNELIELVGDDQKGIVEAEIKKIQAGLTGEGNVNYQLSTSFLPIICLHDIRIQYKNYSAQLDFVVIARNCIIVLETKSLLSDISIDSQGNFTRIFKDFKGVVFKKEGILSPISQNQKHIDILNYFLVENKIIKDIPIIPLVVIANSKSIIDMKQATTEVKSSIIKFDQLKRRIVEIENSIKTKDIPDKVKIEIANYLIKNDIHIEYDFVKRLNLKIDKKIEELNGIKTKAKEEIIEEQERNIDDGIYEKLREYRYQKAREKNIELYFIFNNNELSDLVLNRPKNKEEFLNVKGFGEKKYLEYGEDIINIINSFKPSGEETIIELKEVVKATEDEKPSEDSLFEELRNYRFTKAQERNIKPYFIFNNEELNNICVKMPLTKEEFINVKGFGEKKYFEYGEDIINIIKRFKVKEINNVSNLLYNELKQYRLNKAQEKNLKAYMVFTNDQLNELVSKRPLSKDEFISIDGFGEIKYEMYGNEIIGIISKF